MTQVLWPSADKVSETTNFPSPQGLGLVWGITPPSVRTVSVDRSRHTGWGHCFSACIRGRRALS